MRKKLWQVCVIALLPITAFSEGLRDPARLDQISRDVVVQQASMNQHQLVQENSAQEKDAPFRKKHPIAFGALVGFGIGAGSIAVLAAGSGDVDLPLAMLFYGGIGAGIGVLDQRVENLAAGLVHAFQDWHGSARTIFYDYVPRNIIVENGSRPTVEELESFQVAGDQLGQFHGRGESDIHHARKTQHHREDIDAY